jgi:hypothetical protein
MRYGRRGRRRGRRNSQRLRGRSKRISRYGAARGGTRLQ